MNVSVKTLDGTIFAISDAHDMSDVREQLTLFEEFKNVLPSCISLCRDLNMMADTDAVEPGETLFCIINQNPIIRFVCFTPPRETHRVIEIAVNRNSICSPILILHQYFNTQGNTNEYVIGSFHKNRELFVEQYFRDDSMRVYNRYRTSREYMFMNVADL